MKHEKDLNNSLCTLCPRECRVHRAQGLKGYCQVSGDCVYIARASLHLWEEPCISGTPEMQADPACPINGSGTIFFSGCNLRCIYCQNHEISDRAAGRPVSISQLSQIMLSLQERGAANINLVTPTHYTDSICLAVTMARQDGLTIPIVYNCSGYEKAETLKSLKGIVDIYLTDFKYMDSEIAGRYSKAPDYPEVASLALQEMYAQHPSCSFDESGMMTEGVIVRHLILPGHTKNAMAVIRHIYETCQDNVWFSLMNQYTPVNDIATKAPNLARRVTKREYKKVVDYCLELGMEHVFIQEGDVARESFIPDFFTDNLGLENN